MIPRYEVKYFVPEGLLPFLREMIIPYTTLDTHVEYKDTHQYTVRSIYFDTPNFDFYFDKLEGVGRRKKVRMRVYHDNTDENIAFLEVKEKMDVPLLKYRVPFKAINTLNLFKSSNTGSYLIENLPDFDNVPENAKKFFYYLHSESLKPVILVVYDREPYNCKFDNRTRITFDKNLRSHAYPMLHDIYNEESVVQTLAGQFILEVKYDYVFPFWLRPIIRKFDLRAEAVSKYLMCIDKHKLTDNYRKYSTIAYSHFY